MRDGAGSGDGASRVPVGAYVCAHFGKSLWWRSTELFLVFYLTEYLSLSGMEAGLAIAAGLCVGALFDIVIARRRRAFATVGQAGRWQLVGLFGSICALAVLLVSAVPGGEARLWLVLAANLIFRFAYVLYDLPQNCLLSLVEWTAGERQKAAAGRVAAGSTAILIVAALVDRFGVAGRDDMLALWCVAGGLLIALISAGYLWWATRRQTSGQRPGAPVEPGSLGPILAMMGVTSLAVPVFSKFAPYMDLHLRAVSAAPLVLIVAAAMALSPALWLQALRRMGERQVATACGVLLAIAALALLLAGRDQVLFPALAACAVGGAQGGLGTAIWSGFAARTHRGEALNVAPSFARLTAINKLALAGGALMIGAVVDLSEGGRDAGVLFAFLAALLLGGGIGIAALARTAFGRDGSAFPVTSTHRSLPGRER